MFRALLRLLLLVVIVAAGLAFFYGYRLGGDGIESPVSAKQMLPSGGIDAEKARQTGAAIGEKVATGVAHAEQVIDEGSLTAKIKAKMALDDLVKARAINVTTHDTTVTLSGTVDSKAEHDRAMSLAHETAGVTKVIDDLHTR